MDTLNFSTIAQDFNDEDKARALLESIRWGEIGVICPHCGSIKAYKLTAKPDSKSPVRKGVYKCKDCRKQFTVTVGTIFEDSRIPLHKWLMGIYLMCSSKKGISAHQIHRTLGITYKTAWFMCHRIRLAMTQSPLKEMLTGTVEVDETYIGGKRRGKRGRGAENKSPVVALIERGGELRAKKVSTVSAKTLKTFIRENVDKSANIRTDEFRSYRGLDKEFTSHNAVHHGFGEYVSGDAHTNTLEGWFSLLKRGVNGTFHHVSDKHLDRYVDEFVFRYNNRKIDDATRSVLVMKRTSGKRLTYGETNIND